MKLKGVNPIVQHIEKIVLAITALILLAVISLQFVSQPNAVSVGSKEVAPDQIYNELESTANSLQSQISDRNPSLPDIQEVNLIDRYASALDTSADSASQLPIALGTGVDIASVLDTDIVTIATTVGSIEAMPVPATTTPLVASNWGTLDPYAITQVPQYADFVPAAQPFDIASVTIEAEFSGTDLRAVLEGNDEFPGVPRLFWVSTGMAVMGLDVERQQLLADGSWGSSESITPPPSTPMPSNAVTKDDGLVRLNTIIASAQDAAGPVMRPMPLPTISGPEWQPPSSAADAAALGLTEEQRLQRQVARLSAEVERLSNPSSRPSTRTTNTNPRSGRDPRAGGGTRPTGQRPTNRGNPNDARIEALQRQLDQARTALERLGVETDDARPSTDLLDQEFVQLWAHDLGIEPGATYRYRTRVILNNPYFRKGPYLDEEDSAQQALTIEPFATGEWSSWSEPVGVGAKQFYFVTEASQPVVGEQLPQARVELYSMYYGFYRRSSMTITPGQPIVADMRISGDLLLIDTQAIEPGSVAQYIEQLSADDPDAALPVGLTEAPDRLSVDLQTYMVQIASDPLGTPASETEQSLFLTFRRPDGTLDTRMPSMDRSSPLYSQAQSSATKASRAQLRAPGQPAMSEAVQFFLRTEP